MNAVVPECYNTNCAGLSWITIGSDGLWPTGSSVNPSLNLLYNSQGLMGRICIPETNVLKNVLSSVIDKISSASNSGTFGNFINDLK